MNKLKVYINIFKTLINNNINNKNVILSCGVIAMKSLLYLIFFDFVIL